MRAVSRPVLNNNQLLWFPFNPIIMYRISEIETQLLVYNYRGLGPNPRNYHDHKLDCSAIGEHSMRAKITCLTVTY